MALTPVERSWASRARALALLDDVGASDWCHGTVYLAPATSRPGDVERPSNVPEATWLAEIETIARHVRLTDAGLAVFLGEDRAIAVTPPFPIRSQGQHLGAQVSPLLELLTAQPVTGIVLLRLGRYAVGVLRGERLIASKTGTRYVKSRHRAGGSSQRRFERSRERLVRELLDKACEVTRNVFAAHEADLDYVLLGGEQHTLRRFVQRCRYLEDLGPKTLSRVLAVDRPGQRALDGVAHEVWKSRVVVFEAGE